MRKTTRLLAAALVLAGSLCQAVETSATPADPIRILCVGDSITTGYTDNPAWDVLFEFGYRRSLLERLVQAGYRIQFVGESPEPWDGKWGVPKNAPSPDLRSIGQDYHHGHGGWFTVDVLNHIEQWIEQDQPDIVLLMIGINDGGNPPAAENLKGIVEKIVAARPEAHVVVAQVTPRVQFTQGIVDYNIFIRETLVPDFQRRGMKVTTVDQYRNFLKPDGTIDPTLFANKINHPNATGYERMAQSWFEAIQAILTPAPSATQPPGEFPLSLSEIRVRDPYIVADQESQTYYLYAQGGNRANSDNADLGIEVYRSRDLVHWSKPKQVFKRPKAGFWGNPPIWAPEVHKLDGAYYMFATFVGRSAGRGTQILRSESPEGPFVVLGEKANTPPEQGCLDGTPWIDPDGTRWMVYCHEWAQIKDGGMLAAKMTSDWRARIGESITLFHASQAPWVRAYSPGNFVTDGPFLHRMKNGTLVMIWSSFVKGHGYGMGQAISESGAIAGPWRHVEMPFFGGQGEDGGHAMILLDFSGDLLLVLHQPNGGVRERAQIYRLKEENDLLVLDGHWAPKANP